MHLILADDGARISNLYLDGFGAEVYLEGSPLIISESIRFNQTAGGKIFLGNTNILVNENGEVYVGGAGSYAVADGGGKFYRNVGGGSAVFPIGTANTYAPVTITPNGGDSGILGLSVRSAGNPFSFNPDLPLNVNRNIGLEWTITPTGSDVAGTVRFDYNGTVEPSDWNDVPERIVASALIDTYTEGTNIEIGESFAQANFQLLSGVFAIYSNFPNAIPSSENLIDAYAFPNPCSGSFQLSLEGTPNDEALIDIIDISGRVIAREQVILSESKNVIKVDALNNQQAGLYLVRIQSNAEINTLRIVKN